MPIGQSDFLPPTVFRADGAKALILPVKTVLCVPAEQHGRRVDRALASLLPGYSTWRMARLIRSECVCSGPHPVRFDYRVRRGEQLTVRLLEPPDQTGERPHGNPSHSLAILFADPWMVALSKRPDQVMHPTGPHQHGTVLDRVDVWLRGRPALPGVLRPGVVHRLDRETSGVVLLSLESIAHVRLQQQFERGEVRKSYLAIVDGIVERDSGTIDRPIGRANAGRRVLMSVAAGSIGSRSAVTDFRTLYRWPTASLLRVMPRTGRNHQIRVHLASIGHPLLGEAFYRSDGSHAPIGERACDRHGRHALHAERICVAHPVSGCPIDLLAPWPADLTALAQRLATE